MGSSDLRLDTFPKDGVDAIPGDVATLCGPPRRTLRGDQAPIWILIYWLKKKSNAFIGSQRE